MPIISPDDDVQKIIDRRLANLAAGTVGIPTGVATTLQGIPAIGDWIYSKITGDNSDPLFLNAGWREGVKMHQSVRKEAYRQMDQGDEQSLADEITELLPQIAMPTGEASTGSKLLDHARNLLLPGTPGDTLASYGRNAAIATGLGAGGLAAGEAAADALAPDDHLQSVNPKDTISLNDLASSPNTVTAPTLDNPMQSNATIEDLIPQHSITIGDLHGQDELDKAQEDASSTHNYIKYGVGLALPIALALTAKKFIGGAAKEVYDVIPREGDQRITGLGGAIKQQFMDKDAPLVKILEDDNNKVLADLVYNRLPSLKLNNVVRDVMETGELPYSGVKIARTDGTPITWAEMSAANAKAGDERAQSLERALLLGDEIDRVSNGKVRSLTDPVPDMLAERTQLMQDPWVEQMVKDYQTTMQKMLEYSVDRGWLKPEIAAELRADQPNYVPGAVAEGNGTFLERVWKSLVPDDDGAVTEKMTSKYMKSRGDVDADGVGTGIKPEERMPALFSGQLYIDTMVREVERNAVRRQVVDHLSQLYPDVVEKVNPTARMAPDTITVKRDGAQETWRVSDPIIRSTLQQEPAYTSNLLNAARRFQQNLTTGFAYDAVTAAVNMMAFGVPIPAFMMKGATYEALGSMFGRMNSARDNPGLIASLGRAAGDVGTALMAPVASLPRAFSGEITKDLAYTMMNSARSDGILASTVKALGYDPVEIYTDMLNNYMNTSRRAFLQHGGGYAHGFIDPTIKDLADILGPTDRDITRFRQWGNNPIGYADMAVKSAWNLAKFTRETVLESWRTAHFARFYDPSMSPSQIEALSRETAQLTGDFTRRPKQAWLVDSRSYANINLQAGVQMWRAFKDHPERFTLGMMGLLGSGFWLMAHQMNSDPAFRDHVLNRMTPEQIEQGFVLNTGNSPQEYSMLAIPQEYRPLWTSFWYTASPLMGLRDGSFFDPEKGGLQAFSIPSPRDMEDLRKGMSAAATDVVGSNIFAGNYTQAAANLAGMTINGGNVLTGRDVISKIPTDRDIPDENVMQQGDPLGARWFTLMNSIAGQSAAIATEAWRSAARNPNPDKLSDDVIKSSVKDAGDKAIEQGGKNIPWLGGAVRLRTGTVDADYNTDATHVLGELKKVTRLMQTGDSFITKKSGVQEPDAGARLAEIPPETQFIARYVDRNMRDVVDLKNKINAEIREVSRMQANGYKTPELNTKIAGIQDDQTLMRSMLQIHEMRLGSMLKQPDFKFTSIKFKNPDAP
jgi:hypothetical protein